MRSTVGPEVKDGDTNGHFSALRSSYSTASSRFVNVIRYPIKFVLSFVDVVCNFFIFCFVFQFPLPGLVERQTP